MPATFRRSIAFAVAIAVLMIAAAAAARTPSPSALPLEDGGGVGSGQVEPGSPGSGGGGGPPSTGGEEPVPCGVEVVQGTGPDATVSFTPCDEPEAPVPADPVLTEPTPGMANVRARPFDTATVGDDGRTIAIDFVSGIEPCTVLDHVDVAVADDRVTITLFEGSDPDAGDVACIEIGVFKRTIVVLDEPLGDRKIVDGAA
jgi:hypothetical protein